MRDIDKKLTGPPTWGELANTHRPTRPVGAGNHPIQPRPERRKKKRSSTRKTKAKIKVQLVKHKFVEPVDDDHIMEYGLTLDEIMHYRKRRFNIELQPLVEVRMNRTAEMKEEFGTYCGVKKTIKNWLYQV